ncbi:hypothetical protein [Roseibium litorale]|uniref:Uncharacterized protein n=1 Tax=Roseibium litorale TaxID=2803841 RepID=A0ABR9CID9_9HYPH|nr:hypothetical protein [Roseibium litorale]MBD8890488.1 hypothetical protein [Roseibium litorale]
MTEHQNALAEASQIEASAKRKIELLQSELSVLNNILKLQQLSAGARAATLPGVNTVEELKSLLNALKS